ncbi:hypothetical protein A0J61_03354 [Choanephora cucurbitarum]|uniref:WRKY domain-containing protein n=1 Tax=Choanephora cucurbitarum TaxID=101091 RepID=A0A1C7NHL3_9FUNG|nr:hypothetical protein A0J61_03354 [Choanephora cucurbitarum]
MLTSHPLFYRKKDSIDSYPPSPPTSSESPTMIKSNSTLLAHAWYPPQPASPPTSAIESAQFLNLERVVQAYGDQPELLELILSSKVEEDRRRAEEAKLRRKEIDYVLHKQQSKKEESPFSMPKRSSLPRIETTKRKNSLEMLLSPSPPRSNLKLPKIQYTLPQPHVFQKPHASMEKLPPMAAGSAHSDLDLPAQKRRRREMQAITTIIETREFPYNDDYLWKNNGNTVHKKSGFKSIYYKCTNSIKGCPVNKTVTFKDNGEHLIKYRGQHLPECNRIKRISDL